MPSAYVVVDGQTYRVLELELDAVTTAVEGALKDGSLLSLDVVAAHPHVEGMGQGRLHLRGGQLASVAVLAGPVLAGGHPMTG